MSTEKKLSKIDTLQAIRAFASIAVMLFHGTQIIHERLNYLFLNNFFIAGFSGVDIFFVLSGFIILYTSNSNSIDSSIFLKKRFIRIYPIYWLVTLLLVIAFFISPSTENAHKGDLYTILGSITLFPQKDYVIGVAWTLTYEVIFYLFFAFTYFRKPRYLFYGFTIWITSILITFFLKLDTNYHIFKTLLDPVILNFAFGCIIAFVYKRFTNETHGIWYFWIGLIFFTLSWLFYYQLKLDSSDLLDSDISRVYLFGLPAAVLIFGSLYLKNNVPKWLVYLGDASYSLYLVHGTVLSILIKIIIKFNLSSQFINFYGALSLFVTTLILSCCFYSFIEKNLIKLIKSYA
ncbi:MAG: acyltransferase [Methylococcales bacterium]|nr:acyltransferase [Methylococcales bacterium]